MLCKGLHALYPYTLTRLVRAYTLCTLPLHALHLYTLCNIQSLSIYCWRFESACKILSSEDRQEAKSKRTHTSHFWKFSEWYTNKRMKNALEIPTYETFSQTSTIPAYLWLNINHLWNFRSDCLSQNISCKEIRKTKKNSSKTLLKNYKNTKF